MNVPSFAVVGIDSNSIGDIRMLWQIYARTPKAEDDWANICYENNFIAIGWDIGNLSMLPSRRAIQKELVINYRDSYGYGSGRIRADAGTLWRFARKLKMGDIIITPDTNTKSYYVGKIKSDYIYTPSHKDDCPFNNRRNVKWLGAINKSEKDKIWGKGRVGSMMTVAQVKNGERELMKLLKLKEIPLNKIRKYKTNTKPDYEWGVLAEKRAMQWLRLKNKKPKDVSKLCLGWDIECGDQKYEVKGRHSNKSIIRFSQNEYTQAIKYKRLYHVLIFTAGDKKMLNKAEPEMIIDPARSRSWDERKTSEYLLIE